MNETAADLGAMAQLFDKAARAHPEALSEGRYVVAGAQVELRIVGRALADQVTLPLADLEREARAPAPDLRIDLWDQAETGVAFRPPPTEQEMLGPYGFVTASPDGRHVADRRPHSTGWLDRRDDRILWCTETAETLYLDERARPLHRLLAVWLRDRGVQFVHAGLVALDGPGLLFVGKGGSGKTTSSIACLRDGFRYLGDDFVGLEACDGRFLGHGLYATCLVEKNHLTRFPDLEREAAAPHHAIEEKAVIFFSRLFPQRFQAQVDIGAVVLPRVVDSEDTSFRPASKREAFLALAPSSVMLLPGADRAALDRLGALVEAVPAFWLELGRDIDRIPGRVAEILKRLEA